MDLDRRTALTAVTASASVAAAAAGMVVWSGGERDGGDWQWTLPVALVYGPTAVGLARRSPRLSAAFLLMAVSAAVSLLAAEQSGAVAAGRSSVAGSFSVWLSSWTWLPSYVLLLAVVPHLLPDGRTPTGPARWGLRLGVVAVGLSTLAWMVCPYDELDEPSGAAVALAVTNPVGVPGTGALVALGLVLTLTSAAWGLASLALRWRRDRERTALLWVLGGVSATVLLMLVSLTVPGGSPVVMALAVLPLPLSVLLGAAARTARVEAQLQATQARLAVAQAEERRRLRHDLHDSLGPALAGVALQLEALPSVLAADPAAAAALTDRLATRVQDAVAEVRRLVEGLGPEGSLGLAEALRDQVEGFDAPALTSTLHLDEGAVRDLPAAVEVVAVRVVREALANAARHARASTCTVTVDRAEDALHVRVRDDGIGLEAARASGRTAGSGVGLLSMQAVAQQIGGRVAAEEPAGGGTEVRLVLPLQRS